MCDTCLQSSTVQESSFTNYKPSPSTGPQSDRLAAMKSAFAVSFFSFIDAYY